MRQVQIFFLAPALFLSAVVAETPALFTFTLADVDQRKLALGHGQLTTIVVGSSDDIAKARMVGDRSPDFCLGKPEYRFVTLIRFAQSHNAAARAIFRAFVRRRLDAEAHQLQARYKSAGITRNPRDDLLAVTDFDGTVASQLHLPPNSTEFAVLIIGRKGELVRSWKDVPSAEELREALK